ncbi:MAG: asparaginase [Pseudomonadota bacterium]
MSNPVLIEVTRGGLVESVHRGSIVVSRGLDDIVSCVGDADRVVFPRSSIKALQCIPVVETGAADHFGFREEDLALACGSHVGTEQHAKMAQAMLNKIGLDEDALGCGAHTPLGAAAAKALWRAGGEPTQLHNNCSGKHVGMLATALHTREPIKGYWDAAHPVQVRIHELLCELTGLTLDDDVLGFDGCSVPNWALPLDVLAGLFARLVTPGRFSGARDKAITRILNACWARPDLVAGKGRADTVVMTALPGKVFMKTGAEGVYAGGFPELGLGFALKIDDGTTRASAGTAMALIEQLVPEAHGLMKRKSLKTWRGMEAGEIRAAPELLAFLETIKVRC